MKFSPGSSHRNNLEGYMLPVEILSGTLFV